MAGQLYTRGQYAQAERVCRQIIAARPGNADAHNILGVSLAALGKSDEAIAELKRAIKINAEAPSYHANLGEILRQAGELDEAAEALESRDQARSEQRPGAEQPRHHSLREAQVRQGGRILPPRARRSTRTCRKRSTTSATRSRMTGDIDGAIHAYQEALTQRAVYPEVYNNLGTLASAGPQVRGSRARAAQGDPAEPALCRSAQQSGPAAVRRRRRTLEALRMLGDALKFAPKNVQTLLHHGEDPAAPRQPRRRPSRPSAWRFKEEPDNPEALTVLGQVLHETDRYDEAIEVLEQALKKTPDNPEALNFYGVALKSVGRLDEAREHILKALKLNDAMYGAYANLNDLVDFSEGVGEELFNRMEAIFESVKNPEADQFLRAALRLCQGARRSRPAREGARALHHRRQDEARAARL